MLLKMNCGPLTCAVNTKGGELMHLCDRDRELLWQGDPAVWRDRAPNLFPYIARLTDGCYTYRGEQYRMKIHGFLSACEMTVLSHQDRELTLLLTSAPALYEQYPFDFRLTMTYRLTECALSVTYAVQNNGGDTMYFGIGGHPGFQVPLEQGLRFEDYEVAFLPGTAPKRVLFTPQCFVTGEPVDFPLGKGDVIPLRHTLFDEDAIVLQESGGQVTLRRRDGKGVALQVAYHDFPYLGLWHRPQTKAPYLCIEPWSSLPSRQDVVEDLEKQENLISLAAGHTVEKSWTVMVGGSGNR